MKIRKSHLCQSSHEEAQVIQEEIEKRRKVRLQQGRKQQSKKNATKIQNAVEQKKHGLLMELSSSKKQVFEPVNMKEWEKRQNEIEAHSEDMCMTGRGIIGLDPQDRLTICTQDNYLDDTDREGTAGNWLLELSLPSTDTSHQEPSFPPVPLVLKDMTNNSQQKSQGRNPEKVLKSLMSRIKCQREKWLASHSMMVVREEPQKDAQSPSLSFTHVHSHPLVTDESPIQQKWPSLQKQSTMMTPVVTHDYLDPQMHPELEQLAMCPSPQIHPELAQLAMCSGPQIHPELAQLTICPNEVQLTDVAEVLKQQESTQEKKRKFELRQQQLTTHPEVVVQPTFYQLQKPATFPEQSLNDLSESLQTNETPHMSYFMTDPSNPSTVSAHPTVISQTPYISWQQAIWDREIDVPDQTVLSNQPVQLTGYSTYPVQSPLAASQSVVFSNQCVQFPGQPVSFIFHHFKSNSLSSSSQATINSIAPSYARVSAPVINGQDFICHLVQSNYQPISVAVTTDHLTAHHRACYQNNHQSSSWSDIGSMPASMSANVSLQTCTKLPYKNSLRHMPPSSLASVVKVKHKIKEHQRHSCVRHERSEKVLDKSKADTKCRGDNLSPKLDQSVREDLGTKYLESLLASSLPYSKGHMLQESISQKVVGQGQPVSVLSLLATLAAYPYYAATLCQPDGSNLSSDPHPVTVGVAQYRKPTQYRGPHPDMNLDSNLRKHKSRNMEKLNHFRADKAFKTHFRDYEAYSRKCLDTASASDITSATHGADTSSLTEKGRTKIKPATESMQQMIDKRLLANEQSIQNSNNKVECCTDDSQILLGRDDSKSGKELRKQYEDVQQHKEDIRKYLEIQMAPLQMVQTDNIRSNNHQKSGLSAIHGTSLNIQAPNGEQHHISLGESSGSKHSQSLLDVSHNALYMSHTTIEPTGLHDIGSQMLTDVVTGQKKSAIDGRPRSGIYLETLSQLFCERSEFMASQPLYSMASGDGLSSNQNCCNTFLSHQEMHTPTKITCLTGTSAEVSHQRIKKEFKQSVKPTVKANTYSISGDDEQISDESWRLSGLKNGDSNVAHLNSYTMSTTSESTQNNIKTDTFSAHCLFPIEGQSCSTEKLLQLLSEKASLNLAPCSITSNLLRDSGESLLKSASLMDFCSEQTLNVTGASQHSQSKHRDTEGSESLIMADTGNDSRSTGSIYLQERLDNLDKLINESKKLIDKHRQMIDKNDIEVPSCSSSLLVCNKGKNRLICDHTDQPIQSVAKALDERFHIEMGSSTFSLGSNITSLASKPDSTSSHIICDTSQSSPITPKVACQPSPIISQLTCQPSPITSQFTCQPSPITSQLTSQPPPITSKITCQLLPITSNVTCQPSPIRLQLTCQPLPIASQLTSQLSPITSEFTCQPSSITSKVTCQLSPITSKITCQPSPIRLQLTCQPLPITSQLTSQPSPITSEFTCQPSSVTSNVTCQPSPIRLQLTCQPLPITSQLTSQPSSVTSKVTRQPSSVTSKVTCQLSPITSKITFQPSPIRLQLTCQPLLITSQLTSQPSPITSEFTCQPSPITSNVTCQPSPIRSQLTCQPYPITSELTSQPLPIKSNITSDTNHPLPITSKVTCQPSPIRSRSICNTSQSSAITSEFKSDTSQPSLITSEFTCDTSQPSPITSEFKSDTSQLLPIRSKFTCNTNQSSVGESHRSSDLDENSLDYLAEHSQGIMDEPLPELFNMILASDLFISEDFNETEWLSESSDSLKSFEKNEMAEAECVHTSNTYGDDSLAGNSKTDFLHGINETQRNDIMFHEKQHEMAAMECVLVQHTQCEESNTVFRAIPANVDKHTLPMAANINCGEMGRSPTVLNTKELKSFDNAKNSSEVKLKESKVAVAAGKSLNKTPQPQEADDSTVKDTETKPSEPVSRSKHSVGSRSLATDIRTRFGFHSADNQSSRPYRAQHAREIAELAGATGITHSATNLRKTPPHVLPKPVRTTKAEQAQVKKQTLGVYQTM